MTDLRRQTGRHLLGGTVRVSVAEALMFPTGLVTAAILTRWLGPADYGLLTLAAALVAWLQWMISSMFNRATCIHISQSGDWQAIGTTALRLFLAGGLLAALLLWIFAAPVAAILDEPRLARFLRILAIDIPLFTVAQAHRTVLVGAGRYRERAWTSVARWMTRMLLVATLVVAGFSVEGALLGFIGATVLELLVARRFVKPQLLAKSDFPAARLARFAVPFFLMALGMQLLDKMDIFALKLMGGTAAQAGLYGAAQNLALVPIVLSISFAPLLQATLVRLVSAGHHEAARATAAESMRLALLLLPFAAMAAGASTEITRLIFGAEFSGSGPILAWLICGTVLNVLLAVNNSILIAAGKTRLALLVTLALLPLAVIGYLLLIPRFGPVGAAMVTAAAYLLAAAAGSIAVRSAWGLPLPPMTLFRSLALALVVFSVARAWEADGLLLIAKLALLCVSIPLAFRLSGELSRHDMSFLLSSLKSGNAAPAIAANKAER